jgi:hypothetical protein
MFALVHLATAIALAVTIIGIPLEIANLKMIPVSLVAPGRVIADVEDRGLHVPSPPDAVDRHGPASGRRFERRHPGAGGRDTVHDWLGGLFDVADRSGQRAQLVCQALLISEPVRGGSSW